MGAPALRWLVFEASEGDDGIETFDAEAAGRTPAQQHEIEAEIAAVLAWAQAVFPGGPGALDAGAPWDEARQQTPGTDGWTTLALTLCGGPAFAEAFSAVFAAALANADEDNAN